MCTVSYIPKVLGKSFVLTSNRDEKQIRETLDPQIYSIGDIKLVYPKDEQAGGSWIAMNNSGRICCLLNGAYIAHKKQPHHTLSRGIILKELASSKEKVSVYFERKNLMNTEPFTMVTLEHDKGEIIQLIEFIWDGETKHIKSLDTRKPFIWSSSTLYSLDHQKMRKQWFNDFMDEYLSHPEYNKVFGFHAGKHTEDNQVNVIMERENGIKTVSITQITYNRNLTMRYADLLHQSVSEVSL